MAWKARLFMGLMLTVMLLAIAGPVMADDNNRQERREDRQEFREELREDNDFFIFDHDNGLNDCCHDDFEIDDVEFVDYGFVPFVFGIEEIDIDCDGIGDYLDLFIGESCEVEIEFFDFD